MNPIFDALSSINPNAQNIVLTLLSENKSGAKCLISGQKIAWTNDSFFTDHANEALAVSISGCIEIARQRRPPIFCRQRPPCTGYNGILRTV